MKLTILIQGACYQAGLIGSLHVLKRFRNLFRFQAEIRANRLLSSSGGGGLLFCKEGCTEREATSQAKCAAGITSGGNHTRGSARLLLRGAIQAGFLGTRQRLKRLVPAFFVFINLLFPPAEWFTEPWQCPGETSNPEKNLGEERK